MKNYLSLFALLFSVCSPVPGNSQCPIPNNEFNGYWIASTLVNFAEMFDPQDWTSNWQAGQNAWNYYESGIYPAAGIDNTYGAVVFDLTGQLTETGIRTLGPIICTEFPTSISGHFQHLAAQSDTLAFILHFSAVDMWGDTSYETPTALFVCNTLNNLGFKAFKIDMPQPLAHGYTQIDSVSIVYKSLSHSAGNFILDDFQFEYTPATGLEQAWARDFRVFPSITRQMVRIVLPESLPELQLKVLDTTGKILLQSHAETTETLELDLGGLPSGMYFIEGTAVGKPGRFLQKIIRY